MLFYYSIWMVISFFSFFSFKNVEVRLFFLIFLIFLCLMTGLRYEVGGDWGNYLEIYKNFKGVDFYNSLRITDIGYGILNYISQQMGFADTIMINFICALIFYTCFYFICKGVANFWLPLLISFPYLILVVSMGYTRQSVAIALVLLALKCGMSKKLKKLIFLSISAILFHKSAIIVLMFFPFFIFNSILKNNLIFIFYTFSSFLLMSGLVYMSSLSGDNIYTDQSSEMTSAGALFRILVHFLTLIFYIFYRNKITTLYPQSYRFFDYMAFLILYVFLLAIPFSTLADRFNLYLIVFDIFVFSTLATALNGFNRYFMLASIILFNTLMLFIWLNFGAWSHAWLPYQNYISNYLSGVI